MRRIARLAEVGPGDHVVEVGAGLGSLTLALVETGAEVVTVEADRHLSRAAHRLAKAASRGLATYRDEQKASRAKKRDGAVRDQARNAAKGTAAALAVASQVPVDVVRAVRTRTGVRVLRRMARVALAPFG